MVTSSTNAAVFVQPDELVDSVAVSVGLVGLVGLAGLAEVAVGGTGWVGGIKTVGVGVGALVAQAERIKIDIKLAIKSLFISISFLNLRSQFFKTSSSDPGLAPPGHR
jgi:hypothetical protein